MSGTLGCGVSKGSGWPAPLEPSHVEQAVASHGRVVFIWMQLQWPEVFSEAGARPGKSLNVARLES